MARRSENTSGVSVYQDRFYRNLGKALHIGGKVIQKKFLLGTDQAAAEIANRLLEKLWNCVVAEHRGAAEFIAQKRGRLGDVNLISGVVDYQRLRRVDHGPIWREESLAIAEAIRKARHEVPVEIGDDAGQPQKYVERIANLRQLYPVISFVPASLQLYSAGQQAMAGEAQEIADESQQRIQTLSALASAPLPVAAGQSLYQALDAYAKFATQKNTKGFGQHDSACALRLKDSHSDIPLSQFGISAMESIAAYWAARPLAKKTGRPVALATVTNHLKTARRFIKWLHRSDAFQWTKPFDAEDALRVRIAGLRSHSEIAALKDGVAVWRIDELATIYRYATDRERLLLLLGLNCGFAQAEMCTLRRDEIIDGKLVTTIKRVRQKSQVYGEFPLWPETAAAIGWFTKHLRGRPQSKPAGERTDDYLMLTLKGHRYERQHLSNTWNALLDRVQVDHPKFRRLSFKCLRKTAGQLMRERSDGEVSGVFLCHGKAVASDGLADVYTNRPFGKVASVLVLVCRDLQPLFDAAPQAFTQKPGSSPNISLGKIETIQKLNAGGVPEAQIAEATGVTLQTVARWVDRGKARQPDRVPADNPVC